MLSLILSEPETYIKHWHPEPLKHFYDLEGANAHTFYNLHSLAFLMDNIFDGIGYYVTFQKPARQLVEQFKYSKCQGQC